MYMQCKTCLYDNTISDIEFNAEGICNYCIRHQQLENEYPNDQIQGKNILENLFAEVKKSGVGQRYDCIVGISGGCDSSILLDLVCKYKLHPLAVHFDNGWDTEISKHNMKCVCEKLNVDLCIRKVDFEEFNDIAKSFLLAGVADIDAASDIGMIAAMYQEAEKHNTSYIIEGHSFRTEGIQPISWAYVDGLYISSVHKMYGQLPMKTFPNLWYDDFVRWVNTCKIKRIRPLYYTTYIKSESKEYLKMKYGWKEYNGHHLENEYTAFNYTYYLPQKLGIDERINEYSALIRSNQMSKEEAEKLLQKPITCSTSLIKKIKKALDLDDETFRKIMAQPLKTYKDFETYKPRFVEDEPFWKEMYKIGRVPKSFYLKYCSKTFM